MHHVWRVAAKFLAAWWVLCTNALAVLHPASTIARASADWPAAGAIGAIGIVVAALAIADVVWSDVGGRTIWPSLDRVLGAAWRSGRRVVSLGIINRPVVVSPRHVLCVVTWLLLCLNVALRLLMAADPAVERSWLIVALYCGLLCALLLIAFAVAIEGAPE